MCRLAISAFSIPHCFRITCDGVFETMKESSTTLGSPSRSSISLTVS